MFKSSKKQIEQIMKVLPNDDDNYMNIETYRKHYERMISVQNDQEKIKEMEETYTKNMTLMLKSAVRREQERRFGK